MAKLRFYYGTMGSSKTLRLLTTAYNFEEKNITFLVLKPSKDKRDGENIIKSRVGLIRECISVDDNIDIYEFISAYDNVLIQRNLKLKWILIDECQFLTEEQINQLAYIVDNLDINVSCFGLRTDFTSHLFPASKRLFEIGDEFEEIKSSCDCGKKTSINARLDENKKITINGEQLVIGGNDIYRPLCRKCWMTLLKNNKN